MTPAQLFQRASQLRTLNKTCEYGCKTDKTHEYRGREFCYPHYLGQKQVIS